MFRRFFIQELSAHIGAKVEIAIQNRLIEGVLASVSLEFLTIIETTGYSPNVTSVIPISVVEFVRYPAARVA